MDDIKDVSICNLSESKYVKPYRVLYTQNGVKKVWDCIETHDSVAVLVHNVTRDVLIFVHQFRPAVYVSRAKASEGGNISVVDTNKYPGHLGLTYELCAGIVDKDQSVEEITQGEIMEECGYQVPLQNIEKISTFRSGVGVGGTRQTLFYARVTDDMKKGPGGGSPEEGEFIEVIEVPVKDGFKMISDETLERPVGLLFALMWFYKYKVEER